ncbi:hypothetical protein [Natronorubrum thiooxidans]|uniref:Uncharacterized protein n=1 Tax=Natronorubrum thiooxidans TaxID=308853 RepID=A0A1N7GVK2_9EURY|nr:hypothetical protein [Natronorubrum thiooxidans]SIS16570.1 hypothetical protein SAMN05421752_1169 [Natronorubrum thiooxidans]
MADTNQEKSAEEEFVILINKLMVKGIQDDANPDLMAKVCLNTARELYDYYGAGEECGTYIEYVTSAGFEMAEIEEWLDNIEGKTYKSDR